MRTVICSSCKHRSKVKDALINEWKERNPNKDPVFRCECGGLGYILPEYMGKTETINQSNKGTNSKRKHNETNSKLTPSSVKRNACHKCGKEIPKRRIEAIPSTTLCVSCAEHDAASNTKRVIEEPWGNRDDWRKDRASWKRTR